MGMICFGCDVPFLWLSSPLEKFLVIYLWFASLLFSLCLSPRWIPVGLCHGTLFGQPAHFP
jgi:hypothetical protein